MYHGNVNDAAFVDGHTEHHKWTDGKLIANGAKAATGVTVTGLTGPSSGPDYDYVRNRMRFPFWQ
jgi:prepilin-type processing-associated H-X9-DG protein